MRANPKYEATFEPGSPIQADGHLPSAYSLARTLDELNVGLILTDKDARALHCNQCAKNILGLGTGLTVSPGASLTTTVDNDTIRLRDAVRKAAGNGGPSGEQSRHFAMILGEGSETGLQSIVIAGLRPNGSYDQGPDAAAVVFVTDTNIQNKVPDNILRSLFGLTSSEANLTTQLLERKCLAVAAASSSIGINTARTHLKRIFSKTHTNRQAELLGLLLKTVGFVRFD